MVSVFLIHHLHILLSLLAQQDSNLSCRSREQRSQTPLLFSLFIAISSSNSSSDFTSRSIDLRDTSGLIRADDHAFNELEVSAECLDCFFGDALDEIRVADSLQVIGSVHEGGWEEVVELLTG